MNLNLTTKISLAGLYTWKAYQQAHSRIDGSALINGLKLLTESNTADSSTAAKVK